MNSDSAVSDYGEKKKKKKHKDKKEKKTKKKKKDDDDSTHEETTKVRWLSNLLVYFNVVLSEFLWDIPFHLQMVIGTTYYIL